MKKLLKKLFTVSAIALPAILLSACQQKEKANEITVGTMSGPETQLMQVAKKVALKRFHLKVNIVTFSDYSQPNRALSEGDINANMFQHKPYLDSEVKAHGYKLAIVGKTFVYPVGIYSQKVKSLKAVPNNAIVSIPNDPTNEGRALLLIQKAGLIKLKPGVTTTATPNDIASNPKHLQFKELDAADLTRSLPDVTLSVINTNYAVLANLYPSRDALFEEGPDSPYANLIVVRQGDQNKQQVKELVEAFQSKPVLEEAKKLFKDQAIKAWKNK